MRLRTGALPTFFDTANPMRPGASLLRVFRHNTTINVPPALAPIRWIWAKSRRFRNRMRRGHRCDGGGLGTGGWEEDMAAVFCVVDVSPKENEDTPKRGWSTPALEESQTSLKQTRRPRNDTLVLSDVFSGFCFAFFADYFLYVDGVKRLRPWARRRLMTSFPPGVDMRSRKPWVRARLMREGWYVRFMTGS